MTRKGSTYTLASVYIGTVIGAGFASGQEIFQFFGKYGYKGILGIIVITILFSLIGALVLNIVYTRKIKNFKDFTLTSFGKVLSIIINIVLILLLFINYVVMLSGSGALVYEHFQRPYICGILIMAIITFCVFIFGIEGIAKANNIIVPFLTLIILLVGIITIYKNKMLFSNFHTYPLQNINSEKFISKFKLSSLNFVNRNNWLWSALLYVSFNSMGAMVVMFSLQTLITDRKAATRGGILGGVVLGLLAMVILINLLIVYTDIIGIEVPMIVVASKLGIVWKQIYSIILFLSMFTTAIANGYGSIVGIVNLIKADIKKISIMVCIISIPLATLGFKRLVTFFYPLFGYIGILFIIAIVFKTKKSHKGFY